MRMGPCSKYGSDVKPRRGRPKARSKSGKGDAGPAVELYVGNLPYQTTDADLDTNPGVAENVVVSSVNTVTGESESVTLTETGVNTGIFTGTVDTIFGTVAGVDDDGTFNVQSGDIVRVTHRRRAVRLI